jgi:hypothetical protein
MRLQKCSHKISFWGKNVKNFFKNGILGGTLKENYESPPDLKGRKKSLAGRTLVISGLVVKADGSQSRGRGLSPSIVYWMDVSKASYYILH